MTGYPGGLRALSRPTLRLRLTLLIGIMLIAVGGVLLVLDWALVGDALRPENQLRPGSTVQLAEGGEAPAAVWQRDLISAAERKLLMGGGIGMVLVGALGVGVAYLLAGRALRPLQRVTGMARRLSGETLDERINYDGPEDEVAELAKTFDAMLDRIAGAFESQRRFVANASHELRTPLAVMRTEIDVTVSDPDADTAEFRRMAVVVKDASMRANDLVDALLILARTEGQAGRRLARKVPADLVTGVATAVSAVRAEAGRMKLDVQTELGPAPVVGDPSLLDRLAGNLVENAVRYNHFGGWLRVRTGSDDRSAWLVVANTGFEVEQADVPGLFEPFRRGGRDRTGSRGSGLGLSIVRAVSEAHGGTVTAVARDGGGLEVTVALPAAATTPVPAGAALAPGTATPGPARA